MISMDDTIAAIGTPIGEGGIGIVRVSGPLAEEIAVKIFEPKNPVSRLSSHRLYYGKIKDPQDGSMVDEVLLTLMRKPKTYTREDVLEINCHGGILVLQKVLELTLKEGARLAEPGEFTRRAFLNGRIDLTQAEAVVDMVKSKTKRALSLATQQLKGQIYEEIRNIQERIIYVLSHLEAAIDFPEEDIEILNSTHLISYMEREVIEPLKAMVAHYERGRIYREGISAIIIGKPNVGKSSLLNVLLKENRAIVTPTPGTTRDVIEEFINIKGIPLRIMDTAGMGCPKDVIEEAGIKIAKDRLAEAEIVIFMVDASSGPDEHDFALYEEVRNRPVIVVLNKMDLVSENSIPKGVEAFSEKIVVKISALYNYGIDDLREAIFQIILGDRIDSTIPLFVPNTRHKIAIGKALHALERARDELINGIPPELIAVDIQTSLDHLGEVIGVTTPDDVLDRIFSQFCIGK
ncbi:MAG TPA: tRNA uridine-5-carboxymethylaminomethyl(34) synthesis GTPase MnmE [Syntrophaceae bacterium]|nr:tRNA uridine-5-carboxymethylaminomethyl(34) synthesis GTPase MnmE [Syntrophaceae bacterium]